MFYMLVDYGHKTEIFQCLWSNLLHQTFYCHDNPEVLFSVKQFQGNHAMFIPINNNDGPTSPYSLETPIQEFITSVA